MQEISKENDNHCVSGGFIFDQMDRFAHTFIKAFKNNEHYLFTAKSTIIFDRQICDWKSVKMVAKAFEVFESDFSQYNLSVVIVGKDNNMTYASADFIFVEKDHTYCDTKGE